MKIHLVTPGGALVPGGNSVTALRWAGILEELGHRTSISDHYDGQDCDLLIALHAHRSAPAALRFKDANPDMPLIVGLAGTDLYHDIHNSPQAMQVISQASRLVVLQPQATRELPPEARKKTRVIYQSAKPPIPQRRAAGFQACVLGHLRAVKDPFLPAKALRLLPSHSRVSMLQAGRGIAEGMAARARAEQRANHRYTWLGEVGSQEALAVLASSHLLIHPSRLEGGANVISEAIATGTPILASRIPGSLGILGHDYPGYFASGDVAGLARLILRAENDPLFYRSLKGAISRLADRVRPAKEKEAWRNLLAELLPADDTMDSGLAQAVGQGLGASPKRLPCRFFYDQEGSLIFEEICELPEYYLTRSEEEILKTYSSSIAALCDGVSEIVELGSGSARKTHNLIAAFRAQPGGLRRYIPIDISTSALTQSEAELKNEFAGLEIIPVAAEYTEGLQRTAELSHGARLIAWLGSNVGNFERKAAAEFLTGLGKLMSAADRLLIGVDLRKDRETLERAYDDASGVTARFNLNILARINRELGADFDLDGFRHRAIYLEAEGRVEMYIESCRQQTVVVNALGLRVVFGKGERIHTEDSYKYSEDEIRNLATGGGMRVVEIWRDRQARFATVLMAPGN